MRIAIIAILTPFALAACDSAEPPRQAAAGPSRAVAPTPPPAPIAAPQPSADERLADRVKRALRDTNKVDGQGVGVRVAGGAVTLYGTAASAGERLRIEEFVAGLEGVQSVVSKLVIVQGS